VRPCRDQTPGNTGTCQQIQTEDAIDRLQIQVKEGLLGCRGSLRLVTSGSIDQHIDRTEGARDLLQGSLKGDALKHITGDSTGLAPAVSVWRLTTATWTPACARA